DYATTGDGLLAGLQFLSAMVDTGKTAAELSSSFEAVPQRLENVRYGDGPDPLADQQDKTAISGAGADLASTGRLLIRKSGTEPLIRVMAECEDKTVLNAAVDQIVAAISAAAAAK
ncbi:MAG: phosphoglucosamine mutase, partial [Paracoccaceae bacterium]